jgi:aspartyl-tRNA(Asn)/glutamyl-tRNA(Gln) amidotransferase subunit C
VTKAWFSHDRSAFFQPNDKLHRLIRRIGEMTQAKLTEIDREVVAKIAKLAHLKLSDAELATMTRELGAIIAYVGQLQEVDISDVSPTAHLALDRMPTRADEPHRSLDNQTVLAQAPNTEQGAFAVPTFVDEG